MRRAILNKYWSKDELINGVLQWTLSKGRASVGRPARTYCHVVCYREGEGEVNSLTFLYLNQQALRLTVEMVYERRSATRTLWPVVCWTKKGIQVTRVSWPDGIMEEGKSNDWPMDPRRQNTIFRWKRIFSLGQKSAKETRWSQPTPGKVIRKKSWTEFWTEVNERNTLISADSGGSLARKKERKESEHWNSSKISTT